MEEKKQFNAFFFTIEEVHMAQTLEMSNTY